jgi:hypothetical protein
LEGGNYRNYNKSNVNECQIAEAGSDKFWEMACKGICYMWNVIYEIEGFPFRFSLIDRKKNS